MSDYASISRVELKGIHGHQEMALQFSKGLNIIYGKNGSGKTTLLHILANLMNKDIQRFCYLKFHTISVSTHSGHSIVLRRSFPEPNVKLTIDERFAADVDKDSDLSSRTQQALAELFGSEPIYLPAFRSILEAASHSSGPRTMEPRTEQYLKTRNQELARLKSHTQESFLSRNDERAEAIALKTSLCRRWFGQFVPVIRYPSLNDVNRELNRELTQAFFHLSSLTQSTLKSVFDGVIHAALYPSVESPEVDLDEILAGLKVTGEERPVESPFNNEQMKENPVVVSVLKVYQEALRNRSKMEKKYLEVITRFQESVNRFLEDKALNLQPDAREENRCIILPNGEPASLDVLSSGERHVLTLLFSATHMSQSDGLLLIDEPELSLHVDWQRIILQELLKLADGRQIIACTHAPEVAADHRDKLIEIRPCRWKDEQLLFDVDTTTEIGPDEEILY